MYKLKSMHICWNSDSVLDHLLEPSVMVEELNSYDYRRQLLMLSETG